MSDSDGDTAAKHGLETTGVMDEERKPERPKRETMEALPVGAPEQEPGMDRNGSSVDPVRVMTAITENQMTEIAQKDMEDLAEYFARLGLREVPEMVRRNQLNGSILHTVTEADVNKMDFHSLGEAKAFINLCVKMNKVVRSAERQQAVMVRRLVFWGETHEWHEGPCSFMNQCATKSTRNGCDVVKDVCCCSPMTRFKLPDSSIVLYRDHLTITQPTWKKGEVKPVYSELNIAFAPPNSEPYISVVDHVDYSNIVDVDVEQQHPIKEYERTCADCSHICLCHSLRRPTNGKYYWVNLCQRFFGYEHRYNERPDGVLIIRLRHADDDKSEIRVGIVEGSKDLADALVSYVEEAQIHKGVRLA